MRVGAAKLWLTWLSLTNCRQLDEIPHTHTHIGLIFVNSMPVLSPTPNDNFMNYTVEYCWMLQFVVFFREHARDTFLLSCDMLTSRL